MADATEGFVPAGAGSPETAAQALSGQEQALTGQMAAMGPSESLPHATSGVGQHDGASSSPAQNKSPVSGTQAVHSYGPKPIVPMSYSEKVAAVKRAAKSGVKRAASGGISVAERLVLVAQSVTGGGTVDGKNAPIKGMKVPAKIVEAAAQKLTLLKSKLDAARAATMGLNRYDGEGSGQRLTEDRKKKLPIAEEPVPLKMKAPPK